MQINVERIDSANAKIEAKISKALLDKKENKIAAQAAKNMKIDGLEKVTVPPHIVKARDGVNKFRQDAWTRKALKKKLFDEAWEKLGMVKCLNEVVKVKPHKIS